MVDTMRAERFYADSKTIAVEDIPIPEAGPGEVLVKVAFCGICHSDLSLINGTFPAQRPVVTQGHEASGTIDRLGPGVTGWSEGAPVIAMDIKPAVLDRALELGADHALDAGDLRLRDKIAEITGGRMLDVAFDVVGLKSTFEQALDCITVRGRLVGVGMSAEAPSV